MRSPGHDPAGIISRNPALGMRRLRLDRLFEIQGAMSAAIRFVSDLEEDRISEMAEGTAPLSACNNLERRDVRKAPGCAQNGT